MRPRDVHLESEGAWLPDELDHLRRVFKRVDEDGGEIDRDELQKLLIELEHPLAWTTGVDDLFPKGRIKMEVVTSTSRVLRPGLCRAARRPCLPLQLYNVDGGVLPSRSCVDGVEGPRHRRDAFNNTGPPPQAQEGALESSGNRKISSRRSAAPGRRLAVHHKGIRVRKKAFQARTDTMCLPLNIESGPRSRPAPQCMNHAHSSMA